MSFPFFWLAIAEISYYLEALNPSLFAYIMETRTMKKSLFLVLLLLVLEAPVSAQLTVNFSKFTLPNGLPVILHEDHTTPVVSVNVWYHVGSAREKPGRTGFAHLFEHIMFEGSRDVPMGKFDQWLEAAGGDNNGSTENDRTNYWENVPSNGLELCLFLESDRMGFLLDSMSEFRVNSRQDSSYCEMGILLSAGPGRATTPTLQHAVE